MGTEILELATLPPAGAVHREENTDRDGEATDIQEVQRDHSSEAGTNNQLDPSLPPVDKGRQAWLFCICCTICETLIWSWNDTYGIFQDYYTSHAPFNSSSQATISTIATTSIGIQYMETVLVTAFAQRYPEYVKQMMWASLAICVSALLLSSFAIHVWHLILLQGIIFGIAAGTLYAPVLVWISDWFVDRRGLAAGLIFGGSGLGSFAFPLFMGYLLEAVGFRWTLRIWALAFGVACAISITGINPRVPIRKRSSMPVPREPWLPRDLSPLKTPLLYWMLAISITQALSYFPVSILLSTYTSSLSSATLPPTVALAVFNIASAASYFLIGRITDSYPYPYIIFVSGLGSALAAFLVWGFASSLSLVFTFAAILVHFGGISALWPAAGTDIGGSRDHIASLAIGCFAGFKGIGATIGPVVAASLHDTGSHAKTVYGGFGFRKVEIFVGSMAIATSLGAVLLNFHSTSKKKVV